MNDETSTPAAAGIRIEAGAEPVALGTILFTLVEPRRGYEVAYNRWYERDHFYSGCMIGPYQFAGNRYVATTDLKALRDPGSSEITGDPDRGSYVAIYWVLKDYHDVWNTWAVQQVTALHAAGRMFEERDHVHTMLYAYEWEARREADGIPVELALDHHFEGLVAVWVDRDPSVSAADFGSWMADQHLPGLLPGTPAALVAGFSPLPLLAEAPGDVPRQQPQDHRVLTLWFLDEAPAAVWESVIAENRRRIDASGKGTVVTSMPFKPTIKGTDRFTDQLWPE